MKAECLRISSEHKHLGWCQESPLRDPYKRDKRLSEHWNSGPTLSLLYGCVRVLEWDCPGQVIYSLLQGPHQNVTMVGLLCCGVPAVRLCGAVSLQRFWESFGENQKKNGAYSVQARL